MKSKVEQYAKGDFYVDYPQVTFSKSYIQLKLEAGSTYTGEIEVRSENDVPMKMMVYDDAYLLRLADHSIIGRKGTISITFDATNRKRGSVYDGAIHVIGNGIEKVIPYNIEIVAPFIDAGGVALEDLMKFSAVAESDWNKALSIFYSEEFPHTLLNGNQDYIEAYRSLRNSLDRNQALEEFLVYIHKKRALTLQVEHSRFQFGFPKMLEEHEFALRKNTWGYCRMSVRSDSKFINVHQSNICSLDFEGNDGKISYSIDPEFLDEHKSVMGHIIIENTYQKIVVDIAVRKPDEALNVLVHKNHDRHLKMREQADLIHNYISYRIGHISLDDFVDCTRKSLSQLLLYDPECGIYKLGLLHMSILAGKEDAASEEIKRMEADTDKIMEGAMGHCYYLYLKALLSKEARLIVAACNEIEKALTVEKDKLFYFWLLINLDERYQKDKQWMYSQIEGLVMGGINSPVLALELCDLINEQPLLLKKISETEILAVRFGLRTGYLSKEAEEEFIQLASRDRDFSPQVFTLLATIYERTRQPEIIRIMCSMLINGGRLEHKYHQYYLEGIRCGYKIVGIQENFLKSMDRKSYDLIPDSVLRYFNYKSALSDSEYAYLYANVVVNKRQYLGLYEDYLPNIEAFMEGQIVKGAMSDDLSIIYCEFLRPQTVGSGFAGSLNNIIFKRKLTVDNENIVAVIVSHNELEREAVYPIFNKVAYVDMITESAVISLLDKNKNRFISTIPYKLQKLVEESEYADILSKYSADDFRYVLYQYDSLKAYDATTAKEVNAARDLLTFSEISTRTKQQAIYSIVRYYHEHRDVDILKSYLDRIDMDYIKPKQAVEFIDYLLECNIYDKAFEAIERFGYQGVSPDHLVRLVEVLIGYEKYRKRECLIAVAIYLFKAGQDTTDILSYLVECYRSGVKDLLRIWKRASSRLTKIIDFEENILCETLYTEQWEDDVYKVFAAYLSKKRRGMVIKAFFKRAAMAYLVEGKEIPDTFFESLIGHMETEHIADDTLFAAMLLYYSRKVKLEPAEVSWVKEKTVYFAKRGILLPFFRSFKEYVKLPRDLFVLTFVVTKGRAGCQISFNYGIQAGVDKPECNKTARMIEVLPGYYMKEFMLFHGENLLYEMPEEYSGKATIYESEGMKAKGETEEYENRFEMLNSMLLNQEIGETRILIEKIDQYLRLSAIVEENLSLME